MSTRERTNIIQIGNPVAGGSRYTTRKSAARLIRRGVAVERDGKLVMVSHVQFCAVGRTSLAHELVRIADNKLVAARRGGQVYWNGADQRDDATHPPFRNVQFPRPGSTTGRRSVQTSAIELNPDDE
jgi:hypothetical protein